MAIENLLCPLPPELKGQLTRNLVGNIGEIRRTKMAKISLIGNPRWQSHGGHIENLFCPLSPEQKGQQTQNMVGSIIVISK